MGWFRHEVYSRIGDLEYSGTNSFDQMGHNLTALLLDTVTEGGELLVVLVEGEFDDSALIDEGSMFADLIVNVDVLFESVATGDDFVIVLVDLVVLLLALTHTFDELSDFVFELI